MRIDIVTLFPELCDGFLSTSILGRARAKNLFEAHCHQIRDYILKILCLNGHLPFWNYQLGFLKFMGIYLVLQCFH